MSAMIKQLYPNRQHRFGYFHQFYFSCVSFLVLFFTASVRRYSICPFMERNSSSDHLASSSYKVFERRRGICFFSLSATVHLPLGMSFNFGFRHQYIDPVFTIGCAPLLPQSTTRRFDTICAFLSSSRVQIDSLFILSSAI